MTSEPEKLLPCPFCKSNNLSVEVHDVQPDNYHGGYVTCGDCDAQGADAISLDGWLSSPAEARAAAITAWNYRLSSPVSGTDGSLRGWRLVPEVPTDDMIRAGMDAKDAAGPTYVEDIWSTMLAFAPASPSTPIPVIAEADEAIVDRCAQAMWLCDEHWDGRDTWDAFPEYGQDLWRDRARACLITAGIPVIAEAGERCTAAPDHTDIMETIVNADDAWKTKGYTSALAEVRDMANVGRALMEALPEGYSYINCPSEIVSDLQNELADLSTPATLDNTAAEEVCAKIEAEVRRYAGMYPQASDGRNTFVMFADYVATLTAKTEKAE